MTDTKLSGIKDVHIEQERKNRHLNTAKVGNETRRVVGYSGQAGGSGDMSQSSDNDEEEDDLKQMELDDDNNNNNKNKNKKGMNKRVSKKRGKFVKYRSYLVPNFNSAPTNQLRLIRNSVYKNVYFKLFDEQCKIIMMIVNKNKVNNLHCYEGKKKGEESQCDIRSIGWVCVAVGEETHFEIVYAPMPRCKRHKKTMKIFNYLSDEDRLHLGDGDKVVYKRDGTFSDDNRHLIEYKWYTLVTFKEHYDVKDTSHTAISKRYHVSSQLLRVSHIYTICHIVTIHFIYIVL